MARESLEVVQHLQARHPQAAGPHGSDGGLHSARVAGKVARRQQHLCEARLTDSRLAWYRAAPPTKPCPCRNSSDPSPDRLAGKDDSPRARRSRYPGRSASAPPFARLHRFAIDEHDAARPSSRTASLTARAPKPIRTDARPIQAPRAPEAARSAADRTCGRGFRAACPSASRRRISPPTAA